MDGNGRTTLAALNAASPGDFQSALAGIWEHSPWVVEATVTARPFASIEALAAAMWTVVQEADEERQLALLRAHPDLAGKLAQAGELTPESTNEQASAGLDRLTYKEYFAFSEWNARYRRGFGFPFIICVRDNTKNSIRAAFRRRLANRADVEKATALDEVRKIAEYRLRDRVEP